MNNVERFEATMAFQPVDRLPMVKWAIWWDQTLETWYAQGLPHALHDPWEIRDHFGLDSYVQLRVSLRTAECPKPAYHGGPIVDDAASYAAIKPFLYPKPLQGRRWQELARWAERQAQGDTVIWMTVDGFFWYPRTLLGIEPHLYAFYDQPELLHQVNHDLADYLLWVIDQVCEVCTPNFMTFAEDMSYNHGPMLSEGCFDTFLAPYYDRVIPRLKERGILPFVDSDGDVTRMIPWLQRVGIEGILPLERAAGVDVVRLREAFPDFKIIGAFDKRVMHRGEAAIRQEFDRLRPVMRQGGFIPSVDHQTPPRVTLDQYRQYVAILEEICEEVHP
jgi:hypothetical protein